MMRATFGPLTVTITGDPEEGESIGHGVTKLRAPFDLAVGSGPSAFVMTATFTYGSTRDWCDADAGAALRSVLDDLRSVEPHILPDAIMPDALTSWASWADDLGYFVEGNAAAVRESIESWRTIYGWRSGILDALADEHDEPGDVFEVMLDVSRDLDNGEASDPRGVPLTDAGSGAHDDAVAAGDPWHGQRWEREDRDDVLDSAAILAEYLAAVSS